MGPKRPHKKGKNIMKFVETNLAYTFMAGRLENFAFNSGVIQ